MDVGGVHLAKTTDLDNFKGSNQALTRSNFTISSYKNKPLLVTQLINADYLG